MPHIKMFSILLDLLKTFCCIYQVHVHEHTLVKARSYMYVNHENIYLTDPKLMVA